MCLLLPLLILLLIFRLQLERFLPCFDPIHQPPKRTTCVFATVAFITLDAMMRHAETRLNVTLNLFQTSFVASAICLIAGVK